MAKSNLITTTLISNIKWYQTCPPNWKDKAYKDLSNCLNRIYTESKAAKRGIEFENTLYKIVGQYQRGEIQNIPGSANFKKMFGVCINYQNENDIPIFQYKAKGSKVINGDNYFLYGKLDVKFDNQIIDIKTTAEFKQEKYEKSFQHIFYMFLTGIEFFQYAIAEWDQYPKIKNIHLIDIKINNPKIELEETITNTIIESMEFLKSRPMLYKAYREKFCLY